MGTIDSNSWTRIQQGFKDTERLIGQEQYNIAMVKARQTLEVMVKCLGDKALIVEGDLSDNIDQLSEGRWISQATKEHYHRIRVIGNKAVHDGDDSSYDANEAFQLLSQEVQAFANIYSGGRRTASSRPQQFDTESMDTEPKERPMNQRRPVPAGEGISRQNPRAPQTGAGAAGQNYRATHAGTGTGAAGQSYRAPQTGAGTGAAGQNYRTPQTGAGTGAAGQNYRTPQTGAGTGAAGQNYRAPQTGAGAAGQSYRAPQTGAGAAGQSYRAPQTGTSAAGQSYRTPQTGAGARPTRQNPGGPQYGTQFTPQSTRSTQTGSRNPQAQKTKNPQAGARNPQTQGARVTQTGARNPQSGSRNGQRPAARPGSGSNHSRRNQPKGFDPYDLIKPGLILVLIILIFLLLRFILGGKGDNKATTAVPTSPEVTTEAVIPTEAPTTAAPTEAPKIYTATTRLNVRTEPSTDAARLGTLASGTVVEYVETYDEQWTAIMFEGQKAYVSTQYLSVADAPAESSEAVTTAAP